jgi:hypothetical protein
MPIAMIAPASPTTTIAMARPGPPPPEVVVIDGAAIAASAEGLTAEAPAGSVAEGFEAPAGELGLIAATSDVEEDGAGEETADDGLGIDDADGAGLTPAGATGVAGIGWIET